MLIMLVIIVSATEKSRAEMAFSRKLALFCNSVQLWVLEVVAGLSG
jgi:hypothetical protein